MISDIRPDNRPFYSIILYPAILVSDIRLFSYPLSGHSDIQYLAILVSDIRLFSYPISGHSDIQYLVILISDIRLFSNLGILISNIRPEIQSFCYPASGRIFGNSDIRYPAILISGYSDIRYPTILICNIQPDYPADILCIPLLIFSLPSILLQNLLLWNAFLWRVCCLIFMESLLPDFYAACYPDFSGGVWRRRRRSELWQCSRRSNSGRLVAGQNIKQRDKCGGF